MDDKQPIHSRKNPIKIAPWSYKVINSPDGLYAMGPLVGDNIVRVIPGGAVAIASHLCKRIARWWMAATPNKTIPSIVPSGRLEVERRQYFRRDRLDGWKSNTFALTKIDSYRNNIDTMRKK